MATTPTDLFALTASNADRLARRLSELQAGADIADFVSCVTDRARVSCNAWSTVGREEFPRESGEGFRGPRSARGW
jgi:hypothetical protein